MKTERLRLPGLRARLVLGLLFPLLCLLLLSVVADYRNALGLAGEMADQSLTAVAVALASRLEREDQDERIEVDLPPAADQILRSDQVDTVRYAVVGAGDRLIAGDTHLVPLAGTIGIGAPKLSDLRMDGQRWRMVRYPYASPRLQATVVVIRTTHRRDQSASRILGLVIWPNVLLIAAAVGLVFLGVRFALRPLDRLGAEIAQRDPNDLRALPEAAVPFETLPLIRAMNGLLEHVRAAGRAQQAFLSNAAHQLRTPLAGLQTQLELARGEAPAGMRPRLERMLDSTRRLGHFTRQMLSLARASREAAGAVAQAPVDLAALLEETATEMLDRAIAADIDLGFELSAAQVMGTEWMLRELIANLVDNALRYTPAGGVVTARCGTTADGGAQLSVEDNGPGIPASERIRVFERFYRAAGAAGSGNGLGLAVVREVAERHGARVTIAEGGDGRGTRVLVEFPRYIR